jgi:hypothetical protein
MLKKSIVSFIFFKRNIRIVKKLDFQIFLHDFLKCFKDIVEKASEILDMLQIFKNSLQNCPPSRVKLITKYIFVCNVYVHEYYKFIYERLRG